MELRAFIELLRREGELAEVAAEVDPYLEMAEIADRASKARGPALLFRHAKGSSLPVLMNQFGSARRLELAPVGCDQPRAEVISRCPRP